jgi:hypothetical protein
MSSARCATLWISGSARWRMMSRRYCHLSAPSPGSQAETSFGPLRSVTTPARTFEDRADVALEINRGLGWRRKFAFVDFGA